MSDDLEYRIVVAEREVTPAFTLNQIGKAAFTRAEAREHGWWEDIIAAQLMCALTMEAVLNHVGARVFTDAGLPATWQALDRVSARKKLDAIAEHLKLTLDTDVAPFNHFGEMFRLRNALAHARSVRLATTNVPPEAVDDNNWLIEERVPDLRADWEAMCDIETARVWRQAVYDMSARLCEAAGCVDPVIVGDNASWSGQYHPRPGQA